MLKLSIALHGNPSQSYEGEIYRMRSLS